MPLSRFFFVFVAAAATFPCAPASEAQGTFKDSNPPFHVVSEGAQRATNRPEADTLRQRVTDGEFDTRGTEIAIPNAELETGPIGRRPVISDDDMLWHNPFGTAFRSPDHSRWYQHKGNTQAFRVFPGDENLTSSRTGAGRSEAFVRDHLTTVEADGNELAFSARFRVAKHNGSKRVMLFQSKGRGVNTRFETTGGDRYPAWGLALFVEAGGKIVLVERAESWGDRNVIDTGMRVGDSFDFHCVDNGLEYVAYVNGKQMAASSWQRGDTPTVARWGLYVQGGAEGVLTGSMDQEQLVFVSGAQVTLAKEGQSGEPVSGAVTVEPQ